ncbi:MAG: hypothetical protein ACRDQZ_15655 [Mycobacteriales bacterium]
MSRQPRWFPVAFVGLIVMQVAFAGGLIAVGWRHEGRFPGLTSAHGLLLAGPDQAVKPAIDRLLQSRSAAILSRDREGFLRTVDPRGRQFLTAQDRLFQRVSEVPFSRWSYAIDGAIPVKARAASLSRLSHRYKAPVWLAKVTVSHAFRDVAGVELSGASYLTFVHRGTRWYLGGDDDLAALGLHTVRQPWEFGPVVMARRARVLVLGHLVQQGYVEQVSDIAERATTAVGRLFGNEHSTLVVIVPAGAQEARQLLARSGRRHPVAQQGHLAALSAVTTGGGDSGAVRIVLNTQVMAGLSDAGQETVLRHEAVHAVTREPETAAAPMWLSEGIAEYAAYFGRGYPRADIAPELARGVREGQFHAALPGPESFLPTDDDIPEADFSAVSAYRQAWSACAVLVSRVGFSALADIYRHTGDEPDDSDPVWRRALTERLHLSHDEFVRLWRKQLVALFDPAMKR